MDNQNSTAGLLRDVNLYIVFSVTLIAIMGVSSITPAFPLITRELGISAEQIGLLITAFTLPGVVLTLLLGVLADHIGRKRILIPALFLFALSGAACGLIRERFAGSPLTIGLVMSAMSLTTAVIASQVGRISLYISEKHLLKIGFALYACAMAGFLWTPKLILILISIVTFGLGHGVLIPSVQTLMTRAAPLQFRAGVLSLNGMILRLGQTIAPLIMSFVFSIYHINGVLTAGGVFAFIVFLLCLYFWR
ncbi:MAG: MFS transporter [candidate division KSB1 bacterium]|nr:MFS transporter [candidate division KSB1 bacterium]